MLLSELRFGAFLTYSPHGTSDTAKKSQEVMKILKNERYIGDPAKPMSKFISDKIKENIDNLDFKDLFEPDVFLIPVPKSSLMPKDALWVPKKIAEALAENHLGTIYDCLKREQPVNKASLSAPNDRPKATEHYRTVSCNPKMQRPNRIVLIDDIVTRGATLLGCASKVKDAFPEADICGFAVMRTISNPDDFEKIEDPCEGRIELKEDETYRTP